MDFANMTQTDWMLLAILILIGIIAILVLLTGVYVAAVLRIVLQQQSGEKAYESLWSRWLKKIGGTEQPVEVQEQVLMLDHNYDGIRELDNHMPPWLKFLYFATVVFSVGYLLAYHVFEWAPLQEEEFEIEMQQASIAIEEYKKTQANLIDESNVELLSDAAALEAGKAIFVQNCAACHGNEGQGGVGPNLTDDAWLHGCDIKDVFKVVKYGVPQKGMVPWQNKLKPQDIQQVASYVLSLRGTNPPNPKEPQGEKCE
jgi:cytochrome c oxidase cbb3-type subunit 3